MDRRAGIFAVFLAGGVQILSAGCEEEGARVKAPRPPDVAPSPAVQSLPRDPTTFAPFHSKRHMLTVRLPDGKAWRIDDHTAAELRALHTPTSTELWAAIEPAGELVGRAQCEAISRQKGRVPAVELRTLEDHVTVGPEAFDTRIWVALEIGASSIAGHVFAFGGNLRTCLFFHLRTVVPGIGNEVALSERLAVAKTEIFGRLAIDPPRVTVEADVPRAPATSAPKRPLPAPGATGRPAPP